jgi:hypothetical protein
LLSAGLTGDVLMEPAICAFMHGSYPLRGKHYHEMINPFRVLTDVSYIHVFQVKKLIKEKKNDAGISEYIDINKELQEVSSFLILSCNVIPHARVATC